MNGEHGDLPAKVRSSVELQVWTLFHYKSIYSKLWKIKRFVWFFFPFQLPLLSEVSIMVKLWMQILLFDFVLFLLL